MCKSNDGFSLSDLHDFESFLQANEDIGKQLHLAAFLHLDDVVCWILRVHKANPNVEIGSLTPLEMALISYRALSISRDEKKGGTIHTLLRMTVFSFKFLKSLDLSDILKHREPLIASLRIYVKKTGRQRSFEEARAAFCERFETHGVITGDEIWQILSTWTILDGALGFTCEEERRFFNIFRKAKFKGRRLLGGPQLHNIFLDAVKRDPLKTAFLLKSGIYESLGPQEKVSVLLKVLSFLTNENVWECDFGSTISHILDSISRMMDSFQGTDNNEFLNREIIDGECLTTLVVGLTKTLSDDRMTPSMGPSLKDVLAILKKVAHIPGISFDKPNTAGCTARMIADSIECPDYRAKVFRIIGKGDLLLDRVVELVCSTGLI
ncbi:hypothetical protein ABW19_dt0202392 [Dactylella cylindrospora]|nr:hypothetical protein ABW19_dt0202392 [Dactylella cylindrospora]